MTDREADFMRHAIAVARRNPAAPFGAILVDREAGRIVAEGVNRTNENPTWHGEIDVINRFCREQSRRQSSPRWARLDLYTTAEPCPMCQAAVLWAGIPRVYYGTSIARLQELEWKQIGIRASEVIRQTRFASCEIIGGVLEAECDELFRAAR